MSSESSSRRAYSWLSGEGEIMRNVQDERLRYEISLRMHGALSIYSALGMEFPKDKINEIKTLEGEVDNNLVSYLTKRQTQGDNGKLAKEIETSNIRLRDNLPDNYSQLTLFNLPLMQELPSQTRFRNR